MPIDSNVFFREATLRICGSLDIERALHECLLYVSRFLPTGQMDLHIYNKDTGIAKTIAMANLESGKALDLEFPMSPEAIKQIEAQRSTRIRLIDRLEDDPVTSLYAKKMNVSNVSGIVMDLVLERQMLGVVSILNNGKHNFNKTHIKLFSLLSKPCAIALTNNIRYRELKTLKDLLTDDNQYFQEELRMMSSQDLIGAEGGLKNVIKMVHKVATTDSPVLLLGETGSGKEIIANEIHNLSLRKKGPFIRVNCGAIPASLIDSELFGHEKGAFTGAISRKRGRIERAHGGTLFLDEIGELTPEAQVRLLRVLQAKEIDRIGGTKTIHVNIRVIAATHRNLEEMIVQNTFRADLFYRLRVFPIIIPPLRERKEDIPDLVSHFIKKKSKEMKRNRIPSPVLGAIEKISQYDWPGNIRELENMVERSLIIHNGPILNFELPHTNADINNITIDTNKETFLPLDAATVNHIKLALKLCRGRIHGPNGAAKLLNINPSTLRKRMKRLHIAFGKKSSGL